MTSPTDLAQLYILLSYEKLQRSTISQRQRPTEASLRNRLLVWRFLKKIENEPVSVIASEAVLSNTSESHNNNSWILDLNSHCDREDDIDMEIDSDIVTVVSNHELNTSNYDSMDMEQDSDVNLLLKRAIGAERRQKSSTESYLSIENQDHSEQSKINHHSLSTDSSSFEETDQFFHDLCAELTTTTAALVSSSSTTSNVLRCSTPAEQTLIH